MSEKRSGCLRTCTSKAASKTSEAALALRELPGPAADGFLTAYGLAEVDQRKLDYYRLLDELF